MTGHGDQTNTDLRFDAVLHPHRSLGPAGFYILMAFICGVSFAAGIAFALIGAWPVLGFFGLDVLAIYLAFRLSYRSGRLAEYVRLSDADLAVRRVYPDGRTRDWSFNPYWARVLVEDREGGDGAVVVTSHGRSVALGRFLTGGERQDLAAALRRALGELRDPGAGLP